MAKQRRVTGEGATAVGYLRVSTQEQAESGAGLAAQRAAIEAEAARRGWQLLDIKVDAGLSGKTTAGRVGLEEALDAVSSGQADVLIVAKLDRLSRSLGDFAMIIERAHREQWNLVALDLGIDLSTPAGEFLASVMASAAVWERKIIGGRTKDALAAKRAAGVRLGRPSKLDPKVRRRIEAARAGGNTLQGIADALNGDAVPTTRGGARWHASTVSAALQVAKHDARAAEASAAT